MLSMTLLEIQIPNDKEKKHPNLWMRDMFY